MKYRLWVPKEAINPAPQDQQKWSLAVKKKKKNQELLDGATISIQTRTAQQMAENLISQATLSSRKDQENLCGCSHGPRTRHPHNLRGALSSPW